MCGIAGIISHDTNKVSSAALSAMAECLAHRGPDGQALWVNGDQTAGFAHRRLCVIDLSDAAAQPMHFADRYTIIYNGELYNYVEIREQLRKKGYVFTTSSDTEVILAAYAEYNHECLSLFDGMFALAIWDDRDKVLFCARDRFGEKPFYYSADDGFYFASEIKALHEAGVTTNVDNSMLLQFIVTGNTLDAGDKSRTFYRGIRQLPAANFLVYKYHDGSVTVRNYWSVSENLINIKESEAVERLHELLTVSVKRRLRSDVQIGTSLSGGLDSSGIAAFVKSAGVDRLKTFTASFPGYVKDETVRAQSVAQQLGFENFSIVPTAQDLAYEFEKLTWHHDEPVATGSIYAQFKVFELAAKHGVTVLLDGQGADEVFAGYDHYTTWRLRAIFPTFMQWALRLRELKRIRSSKYLEEEFLEDGVKKINLEKPLVRTLNDWLYFDTFCLGLEQLVKYADRNSMAHGREVRLPYLYHELVNFVFSLPGSYKIRGGTTKWLLRKLMADKLPPDVMMTSKIGFEPPQATWMRAGVMQEYLMEQKKALVKEGILKKVVLDQRSSTNDAYKKGVNEWRWMAASAFIHKKRGLNRNSTPFLKSNIL